MEFLQNNFQTGPYVKKDLIFMFLNFLVLEKNQCFRYILNGMFLLVRYFELLVVCQYYEFDLLKSAKQ